MIIRFADTSCRIQQHSYDKSANQGRYIDLKTEPNRTCELPEAREWAELGEFIESVNRLPQFRTCGCMASGSTPGGHAAPFVDISFDHVDLRQSTQVIRTLANRLCELTITDPTDDFVLELCESSANLPDNKSLTSLRLWLLGNRTDAAKIFPIIISFLQGQNIEEYIPLARKEKHERQRASIKLLSIIAGIGIIGAGLGYIVFGLTGAIIGFFACIAIVVTPIGLLAYLFYR